jgi:hypothetical protein
MQVIVGFAPWILYGVLAAGNAFKEAALGGLVASVALIVWDPRSSSGRRWSSLGPDPIDGVDGHLLDDHPPVHEHGPVFDWSSPSGRSWRPPGSRSGTRTTSARSSRSPGRQSDGCATTKKGEQWLR